MASNAMAGMAMTWEQAEVLCVRLFKRLVNDFGCEVPLRVWGIPRGGGYVVAILNTGDYRDDAGNVISILAVERPDDALVAVDDIIDTGRTAVAIKERYGLETYALVDRLNEPGRWASGPIVFPWEMLD